MLSPERGIYIITRERLLRLLVKFKFLGLLEQILKIFTPLRPAGWERRDKFSTTLFFWQQNFVFSFDRLRTIVVKIFFTNLYSTDPISRLPTQQIAFHKMILLFLFSFSFAKVSLFFSRKKASHDKIISFFLFCLKSVVRNNQWTSLHWSHKQNCYWLKKKTVKKISAKFRQAIKTVFMENLQKYAFFLIILVLLNICSNRNLLLLTNDGDFSFIPETRRETSHGMP